MEWKDIELKKPDDGEVVLIRKNSFYRVVKYHSNTKTFEEIATKKIYYIRKDAPIQWAKIKPTDKKIPGTSKLE
ncbi:MAG: hypothetical protein ACXVC6_07760 [Bacteroidia bacterium]